MFLLSHFYDFFANLTSLYVYDNDVLNFYVFANESIFFYGFSYNIVVKILFAKTLYRVIH